MTPHSVLVDIVQRAAKERKREAAEQAAAYRPPAPSPRKFHPQSSENAERIWVYWYLDRRPASILWLIGLALSTLPAGGVLSGETLLLPYAAGILAVWSAFLLRFLIPRLHTLLTFFRFRTWRARLPFRLEGWGQLVDYDELATRQSWRFDCTITIHCTDDQEAFQAALAAACYLFCRKASNCFYPLNDSAQDPRQKWTAAGGILSGSANSEVVQEIYRFLSGDLAPVAARPGTVERVVIKIPHDPVSLEPFSPDLGP